MNKESLRDVCYTINLLNPNIRHTKEQLQDLYANTAKIHDYTSSVIRENGTAEFRITDQRTSETTKYVFTSNSILLVHEFINKISLDHFAKSASDIVSNAIQYLNIPIFVEQRYVVRCHANPLNLSDARKFITEKVCSIKESELNPYGRIVHGIGLRFFFPPTSNEPNEFDVKIESLLRDPRCLYLECMARFFQPLQKDSLDLMRTNLLSTKEFIYSNISDFLNQFNEKESE